MSTPWSFPYLYFLLYLKSHKKCDKNLHVILWLFCTLNDTAVAENLFNYDWQLILMCSTLLSIMDQRVQKRRAKRILKGIHICSENVYYAQVNCSHIVGERENNYLFLRSVVDEGAARQKKNADLFCMEIVASNDINFALFSSSRVIFKGVNFFFKKNLTFDLLLKNLKKDLKFFIRLNS